MGNYPSQKAENRKEYMRKYRADKKAQGLTQVRFDSITHQQKAQLLKYWETIK